MSQSPEDFFALTIWLTFIAGYLLVGFITNLIAAIFCYRAAIVLDERTRQVAPAAAFLLLIPFFNFIWVFIYTSGLARSYQYALAPIRGYGEDYGQNLGMWWGITRLGGFLPCVGGLSMLASLIIMIFYLVRLSEYRTALLNCGNYQPDYMALPTDPVGPAKPPTKNPYSSF